MAVYIIQYLKDEQVLQRDIVLRRGVKGAKISSRARMPYDANGIKIFDKNGQLLAVRAACRWSTIST